MELFKITCLTCRARLSVRDAALVGQIIGCPRCGMMVQVTPPAGGGASSQASTTPPEAEAARSPQEPSGFDAVAESLPQGVAAPEPSAAPAQLSASFDNAEDVLAAGEPIAANAPQPPQPPPAPVGAAGWSTYKFAALLVAAAITGSGIVAAAVTWLGEEDPLVATASAAPAIPTESSPTVIQPPLPPAETAPAVAEAEPLLPIEPPAEADADNSEPTTPSPATPAESPTAAAPPAIAAIASEPAPVAEPPVEAPPEPRLRIDPLDVDPEGLDLSTLYSGPQKDPLAASQLPSGEELTPSVPPPEPPKAADKAPRPVRRDERAAVAAPAAPPLLSRRLPAVKVTKMPLCRLLDLSVQISGLPVSVAPEQLRMAATSAASTASIDAQDLTIEQLLAAAGEPLRLKPVVDGSQIILQRSGDNQRRAIDYPVDDLAKTPEQVKQVAEWITQLVAPESWQTNGGEVSLAVDGSTVRVDGPIDVQYEVLFLLERYRLTAGMPMRTKYPSGLLAPGAFHASVAERLSAPAVFTFSQFTPLREVFRYWQEELGVAVLVDWPAIAGERLWPQTPIACSAAGAPWAAAMDSVLEPLGLAWRAVDHRTIEITTLAKAAEDPMLEAYRIAVDASDDAAQLVARIRALVEGAQGAPAAEGIAIAYDPQLRVLLVRRPAVVHRKLVEQLSELLTTTPAAVD